MPPPDQTKIAAIILAAGNSSRMNGGEQPKQLLEFGGATLLRRAAQTALAANFNRVTIVLGANAARLRREVEDLPVEIALNENWQSGMSSSIKTGLAALAEDENAADAAIFTLCDQPLVSAELLRRLGEIFASAGKSIAACEYARTFGVPAVFARAHFAELSNLRGDEGAKKIIKKYIGETIFIFAPEATLDVDTWRDYKKLKQSSEKS